jgi:endo-1,4-beta-xylanase
MRKPLLSVLFLTTLGTAAVTPHSNWQLVPGAEDLIKTGNWACVSGVSAASKSLTVSAGSANYTTVINTSGPLLRVTGDFSVLASLSAPANSTGVMLTLVGTLNSGDWWNGLKRLDVGLSNGTIQVSFWTGATPSAAYTQSFGPVPALAANDTVDLELAHVGSQNIVYINGQETGRFEDPGLFTSGQVYLGFNVAPSNTLNVTALAAASPAGTTASFYDSGAQVIPRQGGALRDYSGQQGFLIGGAVDPSLLANPAYSRVLGQQMNVVVAENAMKFAATHPGPNQYNFCQADQIVRFAQANGMKVRAHTLVWQQSLPAWLTTGNYTPADASNILRDHIRTVMGHFKGQVIAWDVVNEAIAYGAPYGPMPSYWLTQLGSGYVGQAFRWAREADPDVKLFYNDTGGEGLGAKSDAVYNLVSALVAKGVPIDGVGLQMHVTVSGAPSGADLSANIQRYARLGLEVHITEMDVRIPAAPVTADLLAQADVYKRVLETCLANSNCTALITWGVSDANSWIPGQYPGLGAALLFDSNFQGKPAASAMVSSLINSAAKPRIFYGGAVVHGGVAPVVSPGSLVDLYGSAFAPGVVNLAATVSRLPQQLGSSMVIVNSVPTPLVYVSPGQAIFQMPYEVAPGTVSVVVRSEAGDSPPVSLRVQQAAPSILVYNFNRAVALNQNGAVISPATCAAQGSLAVMYAIGSGPLDNPVATAEFAPLTPLSREKLPTTVTVGGQTAEVLFAGLVPTTAGLLQINFRLPAGLPAGDAPVQLSIGTAASNSPLLCVAP